MSRNPVRGIDHVGITVPDIEEASRFLEAALGAVTLYDVQTPALPPMAGPEAERELGLAPAAKVVHMRLVRLGDGPSLELFEFSGADQRASAVVSDYGLQHVAVYVDDIAAAIEQFARAGGQLLSSPHPLMGVEAGEGNAWVYGKAPWGGLFELITYPAGVKGLAPPRTRWTPPPTTEASR